MHGVDVLVNTNYYLKSKIFEGLGDLDVFACLVSAACHDVGHPGNNNPFEINLESELAVRYNDISVLENMHAAKTWEILKRPGCDFLEGRSVAERRRFRLVLIEAILATDMSKHKRQQDMLAELIDDLAVAGIDLELWGQSDSEDAEEEHKDNDLIENNMEDQKAMENQLTADQQAEIRQPSVFDNKQELALVLLPLAVHTADLSNPAKSLPIYQIWASYVMEEFWAQGDKEKEKSIPVTQVYDRDKTDLPTCQTGFINHVIKPWFDLWTRLLPEKHAGPLFSENVNINLEFMKKELERIKAAKEKMLTVHADIKQEEKNSSTSNTHNQQNITESKEDNKSPETKPSSTKNEDNNANNHTTIRSEHSNTNKEIEPIPSSRGREFRNSVLNATFDDILKTQILKQQRDMEELRKRQMQLDEGTQIDETDVSHHNHKERDNNNPSVNANTHQ
ncbi:hypothetical protein RFI_08934 [Reticulomyxa filosa]|uniref:Phosphodiesterase n=1 Tax=Reticulomyxa filosa TaxID=46433 RepID=X6NPI4_RETFI|nr:hypothetical protein RFI_08934 [Reticulomyxa filosa]|eukprot:ETO28200.1 hypothetical protein RFI_08934 [Reticulomyxa filosa]